MNNEIIAAWALSNWGGVAVYEMEGDYMVIQYYDNEPETVEIEWDDEGEAYIKVGEIELYLNECMRV